MAEHNDTGHLGETLAVAYLKANGHQILHTNYRWLFAEVDIISKHNNRLVFTEVKTRVTTATATYYPEEFVDGHKEQMLIETMEYFLEEHQIDLEPRFDIVAVRIIDDDHEIYHFEDAF
ncbi:MAG: YraN family protein [Chitinophagales bacterium]